MPETLEIQLVDKGSAGGSGPPRPPGGTQAASGRGPDFIAPHPPVVAEAHSAPKGPGSDLGTVQNLLARLGQGKAASVLGEVAGAGGAAGAGVGGIGSLAAAAGPIGAAIAVAELASEKLAKGFDTARQAVEGLGHGLAMTAGNDYLGMFKKGLDNLHSPLKDIPIVGKATEAAFQAALAPVRAFTDVTEAFTRRAHELAMFSGPIAGAEAQGMVQGLLDDLKEANELGPDMARMLEAENSLQHDFREIMLPIKQAVIEVVAPILETLAEWMRDVKAIFEAIKEMLSIALELAKDFFTLDVEAFLKLLAQAPDRIGEAFRRALQDEKQPADAGVFLRDLYNSKWTPDGRAVPPGGRDARPRFPLLDGM